MLPVPDRRAVAGPDGERESTTEGAKALEDGSEYRGARVAPFDRVPCSVEVVTGEFGPRQMCARVLAVTASRDGRYSSTKSLKVVEAEAPSAIEDQVALRG